MHTVAVGSVIDSGKLRALAHSTKNGVHLSASHREHMLKFLRELTNGTCVCPLSDIKLDLQLFEGITIREIKDKYINASCDTAQSVTLELPRLGPYEHWQVLLLVHLPDVARSSTLERDSDDEDFEDFNHISTSYRLAELEQMVQSMPGKIAECIISYHHPMLVDGALICQESTMLSVQRTNREPPRRNIEVMELDMQRTALALLFAAMRLEQQQDKDSAINALREAEQMIHAFCTEYDLSLEPFGEFLATSSTMRFRMSARYQISVKRKESFAGLEQKISSPPREQTRRVLSQSDTDRPSHPRTEIPKSTISGPGIAQQNWKQVNTLGNQFMTEPRAKRSPRRLQLEIPPKPQRKTLVTTLRTVITEEPRARTRRGSTGSMSVQNHLAGHFVGHKAPAEVQKVIWDKPKLKKLPTSEEVRKIVRQSSSRDMMQYSTLRSPRGGVVPSALRTPNECELSPLLRTVAFVDEQKRLRAEEDDHDIARSIWKSHKEERGEVSMVSEDELTVNAIGEAQHETTPPMPDILDSPADYFSKNLKHGTFQSPLAGSTPKRIGPDVSPLIVRHPEPRQIPSQFDHESNYSGSKYSAVHSPVQVASPYETVPGTRPYHHDVINEESEPDGTNLQLKRTRPDIDLIGSVRDT